MLSRIYLSQFYKALKDVRASNFNIGCDIFLFRLVQTFCESDKVSVSILKKYIQIYKFGVKSLNHLKFIC